MRAVIVLAVLAVIVREARIWARDKRFSAQAVMLVSPPRKRWWQELAGTFVAALIVLALVAAAIRWMPRDAATTPTQTDTTPNPTPTPSASSTPGKGHTK